MLGATTPSWRGASNHEHPTTARPARTGACLDCPDSSPVINRLSNPALHWHTIEKDGSGSTYDFDVGLEHRSDGQVTEVTSAADADRAQRAYDGKDRAFFDTISRGSNYFSFAMKQRPVFGVTTSRCARG